MLLAALFLMVRLKRHFVLRAQQFGPHLSGSNETGQAIVALIVFLDFLIHPLSLLLLYLAIEGFVRFAAGMITGEVVPNLLVSLCFRSTDSASRKRVPPVADIADRLPDGRIRIASASQKTGWNSSITIGIGGQWFEVEREDPASPPWAFIYILRPASPGKVLRGYQEYDAADFETMKTAAGPAPS